MPGSQLSRLNFSDDGYEMWLNNEKIHMMDVIRSIVHEPEMITAKLRKGDNKILMKISQAEGSWEFKLKIGSRYPVKIHL